MATRRRAASGSEAKAELQAYFAALPARSRRRMAEVRKTIRSVVPEAEEAFSYRIPAFKLDGRMLVWYAAWTEHTSVYPLNAAMRKAAGTVLKEYQSSKGTLKIPLGEKLPVALIKRIVMARATEITAR